MKKITVLFMILVMLVSTCFVTVSANNAADSLDNHLIVHFDFEGDTQDAQLSDKATGGQHIEKLIVNTTGEEINGIKTEIKDGIAYICEAEGDFLKVEYTATTGDIPNVTTGMTVYARVALKRNTEGTSTSFADYLYIQNILRAYVKNNSTTATTTMMEARVGEAANSSWAVKMFDESVDFVNMNGQEWIDIAYVYTYDPDADILNVYGYISFDGGKNYSLGTKWGYNEWSSVTEMFSNSTYMILGKDNRNKDNDVAFLIDDVKVYNTNLTVTQLSQIVPTKEDDSNANSGQSPDTNAPDTNAPDTNAPDTNAPDTNAMDTNTTEPTTNIDDSKSGGCKSLVVETSGGLMVLLAGAWVLRKKK